MELDWLPSADPLPPERQGSSDTGVVSFDPPGYAQITGRDRDIIGLVQFNFGITGMLLSGMYGPGGLPLTGTGRGFTIFIDGVDRTKYVKDPSISINMQLGSLATASFTVIQEFGPSGTILSTLTPDVRQRVVIHHDTSGYRLFAGTIESVSTQRFSGTLGAIETQVNCSDWGLIAMRRAMAKWYTEALGSFVPIIARDVVDTFLYGSGVTFGGGGPTGANIGEQLYNWMYVGEVFRSGCDAAGLDWRIDQFGELRFIDRATGSSAAPFAIEQDNGFWRSMTTGKNMGRYANRVIVKNSQDIGALWVDTDTASSANSYRTTYPLSVQPLVTVGGLPMIVAAIDDLSSTPGAQYYYIPNSIGLFTTGLAPNTGAMVITYPSRTAYVAIAEDDAEIALYGQYDYIEEAHNLTDLVAMQALADSLLAQLKVIPINATIETDTMGLEPGQLLSIDANGVTDDFLVESVSIVERYNSLPTATVTASTTSHRNGSALQQAHRRLSADRNVVDRVTDDIRFVLAETIEGVTNPGLTTGVKQAFRTYPKRKGLMKQCRLHFGSVVAGTPTTDFIEIDVLQNGVSIFGIGGKMTFPAGATTEQVQLSFANSPMEVLQGDIFTVEVLQADSAATDGWLHLQVQG